MTIAAHIPSVTYSGTSSGNLGPFSVTRDGVAIPFSDNSHIVVKRYASTTATSATLLVEGTDYTLTTYNATGPVAGAVTLTSPQTGLLTDERLEIYREQPDIQALDIPKGGNFSGPSLEDQIDRLTEMVAEVRLSASMGLKRHWSETTNLALSAPASRAGMVFTFDASGNPVFTTPATNIQLANLASEIQTLAAISSEIEQVADIDSEVVALINGKADEATSLSGYGITDAYTQTQVDGFLALKQDASSAFDGDAANLTGTLSISRIADDSITFAKVANLQTTFDGKADSATTLAGYGITDGYTQTEVDNLLSAKQDASSAFDGDAANLTGTLSVDRIADGSLTIAKVNGLSTSLSGKLGTTDQAADSAQLEGNDSAYHLNRANHTGAQAISTITNLQTELNGKADAATTLGGYGITNAYTQFDSDNRYVRSDSLAEESIDVGANDFYVNQTSGGGTRVIWWDVSAKDLKLGTEADDGTGQVLIRVPEDNFKVDGDIVATRNYVTTTAYTKAEVDAFFTAGDSFNGDAGTLTGTLAAARIADDSLPIAKTTGLQTALDGKHDGDASTLTGTLSADRIADDSLTIAKTNGLQAAIDGKAASATTLGGYGITNAYTQFEINSNFVALATPSGGQIIDTGSESFRIRAEDDTMVFWVDNAGEELKLGADYNGNGEVKIRVGEDRFKVDNKIVATRDYADIGSLKTRSEMESYDVPAAVNTISIAHDEHVLHYQRDASGDALTTNDGATWSPAGTIMPQHWGGQKGTSDFGPSISSALAYAIAREQSSVYIPAGEYTITTAVTDTLDAADTDVELYGDGKGLTVLVVNNTTGGISVTTTHRTSTFNAHDLSVVVKSTTATGYGIKYQNSEGGNQGERRGIFKNLYIGDYDMFASDGGARMDYPLEVSGSFRPMIDDVIIWCQPATAGTGIGININGTFKAHITNSYVVGAFGVGVSDIGSDGEGGYFADNTINQAYIGYDRDRTPTEPEFWFVNNHINCFQKGLRLRSCKYAFIQNNLMYTHADDGYGYIDFEVEGGYGISFHANTYREEDDTARIHIKLTATAGEPLQNVMIADEHLHATATYYVSANSLVSNLQIRELPYESTEAYVSYPDGFAKYDLGTSSFTIRAGNDVYEHSDEASIGPIHASYRDSDSPADGDSLAEHQQYGRNHIGDWRRYTSEKTVMDDVTDGSETGRKQLFTMQDGVQAQSMSYGKGLSVGTLGVPGAGIIRAQYALELGNGGPKITFGPGDPEGSVDGNVGDLRIRTNGGAGTTFYVKESGTGPTGWVAK